jgi:Flp pilus assembly protein TadG
VEFVLVLPLIVLVLVACLEVAALARARVVVVAAAREGARVAATHPDPADAVEAVRTALGETLGDAARVSVSRPHVVGRPAIVEVAVRQPLTAPLLDTFTVTLTGRSTMRVER